MDLLNGKNTKVLVALFFTITGATGLIYQISWFKYISLFLGNTTYAQMIVLATFLGGLAIGNYYFGKKSEKITNYIQLYGILELLVGIYCFLYPTLSMSLGDVFLSTAKNFDVDSQNLIFIVVKFIFASTLLLLPTFAMGGTLPLISKFFIEHTNQVRKDLAILYFLNSFGAVWGIILSGFFMIKLIGLNNTIYLTAFINTLVGILAIALGSIIKPSKVDLSNLQEEKSEIFNLKKSTLKIIMIVAGSSGMAALLYEIVWVRLLVNFLGSSTYAFSIMLLAFISGITAGSFVVSQNFIKKYNKIKLVVFLQIAIAFSTMISLFLYERFPYYLWNLAHLFNKTETTFGLFLTIEFVMCFLLMVLPTIFMGMSLPVIVDIVSNVNKKIGATVGTIFSINTIGTVLGVLLTSLIFIPLIGIKGSFEIGIAINLISAIVLFISYDEVKVFSKIRMVATVTIIFGLFVYYIPEWNVNTLVKGVFRHFKFTPPETFEEYTQSIQSDSVLFYKEGISANVAILKSKGGNQKRLIINGKADASSITDMPTQVLLGQLPLLLHPNPKNAFIVGFGSGTTVGSVLTHEVDKVDCVEMSNEVIEASSHFEDVNNKCLEDPRVNLVIEDAHTYLKLSKEKYDVVISEPSNPWVAGIGNLFSEEYFDLCKSKLTDNGVMIQWFHLYELNDEILKLVISTFKKVFPEVQIWNSINVDILLIGAKNKIDINIDDLKERFNKPKVNADFKRIGIDNLFSLLTLQKLSNNSVYKLTNFHNTNSELHPKLEFLAPKSFYLGKTSTIILLRDEKLYKYGNDLYVYKYLDELNPDVNDVVNAAQFHLNKTRNNNFAYGLTKYYIEKGYNNYELARINYLANKRFGNHFPELGFAKLLNEFSDSMFVRKEEMDREVREHQLATSFLKTYSIEPIIKDYLKTKIEDKPEVKVSRIENLINLLMNNGELGMADSLNLELKKMFKVNRDLSSKINLRRYLFNSCRLSLHNRRDMEFLGDFKAMGDFYPNDEYLIELKKYFLLDQDQRKLEKKNKENFKNANQSD